MSQNPVGLAIPPSEYDEDFVVASIRTFIKNLEMIDNVILNNLANQNKAQCELIKKSAKTKGLLIAASNTQLTTNIPNIPQPVIVKLTSEISLTQNLLKISPLSLGRYFNNTKRTHTKQAATFPST